MQFRRILPAPIGGVVAVRGILSGTTLTLGLSLQRKERSLTGSDEAYFWGTTYFRIRVRIAIGQIGQRGSIMRNAQMTLDEDLVIAVDKVAKRMGTMRSAFTRDALRSALGRIRVKELERKQRDGYRRKPVKKGEFDIVPLRARV